MSSAILNLPKSLFNKEGLIYILPFSKGELEGIHETGKSALSIIKCSGDLRIAIGKVTITYLVNNPLI
ncbi:MAG: hypothetical protein L0Y68_02250 [Candidatus Dadabacteria bacterium]|nr:hypothetical protein [Candidatus Dadabacteria bacterium]